MYGTDVTDEKPYRSINELITHIPVDFVKTFPREPIGVFVLTKLVFFFLLFPFNLPPRPAAHTSYYGRRHESQGRS